MNNIENSIRHLQSSIDIRSNRLTVIHGLVVEYIGDYKNALKDGNSSLAKDYKHEINSWKAEIVKEVKQQKIEKKMLAMMLKLNRAVYSKRTEKHVKLLCVYLDNL